MCADEQPIDCPRFQRVAYPEEREQLLGGIATDRLEELVVAPCTRCAEVWLLKDSLG